MNLSEEDRELARKYIAYVWAWKKTGKYEDEVMEMKKRIRVSKTHVPTVYEVWNDGRHGDLLFGPVEVRCKQEELNISED